MWIFGMIAASLALTLLILLIKGGIKLVGGVVGAVITAVFEAIGLLLSGILVAVIWTGAALVKLSIFTYQKITTRATDVDDDDTYDWMKSAQLNDE